MIIMRGVRSTQEHVDSTPNGIYSLNWNSRKSEAFRSDLTLSRHTQSLIGWGGRVVEGTGVVR